VFISPDIKNGQLGWIHANEPKPAKNVLLQVDYHIESSIVAYLNLQDERYAIDSFRFFF
jgi:hypothetical protein